jgi:hypothetical protein
MTVDLRAALALREKFALRQCAPRSDVYHAEAGGEGGSILQSQPDVKEWSEREPHLCFMAGGLGSRPGRSV